MSKTTAGWTAGKYWCERSCDVSLSAFSSFDIDMVCAHQYGLLLALAAAYGTAAVEDMLYREAT
jgi:hypothetical protein